MLKFIKKHNMKDFSQHGESIWLYNYIAENNIMTPEVFVDIGALDGITNSNARLFLSQGWKGILFEPNSISFNKLFENTRDFNCDIYNVAISNVVKKSKFQIVTKKNFAGHSNINDNGDYNVLCATLDIFVDSEIGILDIDAEGHDNVILNSVINDLRIKPKFIIVEGNTPQAREEQMLLLNKEYKLINTIKVNTIWERV